jgi:hypothetical protein
LIEIGRLSVAGVDAICFVLQLVRKKAMKQIFNKKSFFIFSVLFWSKNIKKQATTKVVACFSYFNSRIILI